MLSRRPAQVAVLAFVALALAAAPSLAERRGERLGGERAGDERVKRYRVMQYDHATREWSMQSSHDHFKMADLLAMNLFGARVAEPMRDELDKAGTKVGKNDFVVKRTEYDSTLGSRFTADVKTWKRGMRVLDAGAGEAGFFRTLRDGRDARHTPELVAIGARRPEGVSDADLTGIRYHEGYLGHDGKLERELGRGQYDRIIDTYGASHYTRELDKMVVAYGELLKPGGKAFLHFSDEFLTIKGTDGERVEVIDYLRKVEGLKLRHVDPNREGGFAVVLERRGRGKVKAPALELTDFFSGGPPVRLYRESGAHIEGEGEGRGRSFFDRLRGR